MSNILIFTIWCNRICKNIRKVKYLIVDTTGKNPNVFYELGFAHALAHTKAIIITQKLEDAPFDVRDLNHIEYSEKDLPDLRDKIKKAIEALEKEEADEGYANKSTEEIIIDLKSQVRAEEDRADKFKNDLKESEERERKLKKQIGEIESIQKNPAEEAKIKIIEYEKTIAELKARLDLTEETKGSEIKQLRAALHGKEKDLNALKEMYGRKDTQLLSGFLLDDSRKRSEANRWLNKAYKKRQEGDLETAAEYCSKAIELDPNNAAAYNDRGVAYTNLKQYEKAIIDYNKAIELDPNDTIAYSNRGQVYSKLQQYENAVVDCNRAIELSPNDVIAYLNLSELLVIKNEYRKSLDTIISAHALLVELKDKAVGKYLECISKSFLDIDVLECISELDGLLLQDFTFQWSFDEIESWLKEADISDDKKTFITRLTELIKKHKAQ